MRRSRGYGSGGFTLLEVIVALALVSGILITAIASVNYTLSVAEQHEDITVSTMLAGEKLAELQASPSTESGTFDEPYEAYSYEVALAPFPYPGMLMITVTVLKDGQARAELSELVRQ